MGISRPKHLIFVLNVFALFGTVAWLATAPGWEPFVALISLVATLMGLVMMNEKTHQSGRGGDAIVAEEGATVNLDNQGVVRAGKGGTGGAGGAAIHVAAGVTITIVNEGVIAGGDAGNSTAGASS